MSTARIFVRWRQALLLPSLIALLSGASACKPDEIQAPDRVAGHEVHDSPGAPVDTTAPPAPPEPPVPPGERAGFYVSPAGSVVGDGSKESPWTLARALEQPGTVQPGDTIWMLPGRYAGEFLSRLTGQPGNPVVLRALPGERVTIDGRFAIEGRHAVYWGFEAMYSNPARVTGQAGSDPSDVPRERVAVFVTGAFNRLVNLVVHDMGDGIFAGTNAEGVEINGCIVYNNGWRGPDRGHGHNMYLQNRGAAKRIIDNVVFNSFAYGIQIYGSDAAAIENFVLEGNAVFGAGAPVAPRFGLLQNMIVQGGAAGGRRNFDVTGNSWHHTNGLVQALRVNNAGDMPGDNFQFRDNVVHGGAAFNEWTRYTITGNTFASTQPVGGSSALIAFRRVAGAGFAGNVWDGNTYALPASSTQPPFYLTGAGIGGLNLQLPQWSLTTGYDRNSVRTTTMSGTRVIVRPSVYERGRAVATVWNWDRAASAALDLSRVLSAGDRYVVHHVFDLFGAPVASGTYDGQPASVPLRDYTPPQPIGYDYTPPSTGTLFNVFVVEIVR